MDLVTRAQAAAEFPGLVRMFEVASLAQERAYAPYSNYRVGCALLLGDGKIVGGCNVENASYGGTICAERGAVMVAVSGADGALGRKVEACLTVSPAVPTGSCCGLCRQVLFEFGGPAMRVFNASSGSDLVRRASLDEMLPFGFGPTSLDSAE
jgi:cytidine deaminase